MGEKAHGKILPHTQTPTLPYIMFEGMGKHKAELY